MYTVIIIPTYTLIYPYIPMFITLIYPYILMYTLIYTYIHMYTLIYPYIPMHTSIDPEILLYLSLSLYISSCHKAHKALTFSFHPLRFAAKALTVVHDCHSATRLSSSTILHHVVLLYTHVYPILPIIPYNFHLPCFSI